MGPKWDQNLIKMGQKIDQNGTKWTKMGPKRNPERTKWTKNGPKRTKNRHYFENV